MTMVGVNKNLFLDLVFEYLDDKQCPADLLDLFFLSYYFSFDWQEDLFSVFAWVLERFLF